MKAVFRICVLFFCLSLVGCSNDDSSVDATLTVNGEPFALGTNGITTYNLIKSENSHMIWLNIRENTAVPQDSRTIAIFAVHPEGPHSGTYVIKNDESGPGISVLAMLDAEGHQFAGGSLNSPTGSITITDLGQNKFKLDFNDVVLDPGTDTETTISGSCTKTFTAG